MNSPLTILARTFVCILAAAIVATAADVDREASEAGQQASPGATEPVTPLEIYGQGVRETKWLSPQEELAGFHLPRGFEARLFASEPQIAKPLNLAFDDRGRMWVTQSFEYPYPAQEGTTPRDAVVILADTDGDGSADEVTTFADELNIPIGVLPYGEGCICFSIPNLLYLRDTDGDGKCDQRDVLYGPFDTTRDTHGMVNSLREGGDGWIYACHGFNNQSQVTGRDGHAVTMHSGNTFRFLPDGSRIEQVTQGQVNPFGMTEDEWGYRYSADCHSKPITQLIFGACYPSFGRPDDGLGFLPPTVDHLHGSTAICGIQYYTIASPVVPLRGQMISGNVMTSRLNRNQVTYDGATAKGIELSDFMTSDDPWFRPVDLRLGPDGHLYVADFYNKIIGHYEVPLDHPDRDRSSGRIWQIRFSDTEEVPRGGTSQPQSLAPSDSGGVHALHADLAAPQRIQTLQQQFASHSVDAAGLLGLTTDSSELVRVAAMRLADEAVRRSWSDSEILVAAARAGLTDKNPHFVQASTQLLGRHGTSDDIAPLLGRLASIDPSDPVLRQTFRIAIRNLLRSAPSDEQIWSKVASADLASILMGLQRVEASDTLLAYLADHPTAPDREALLAHAAKHSGSGSLDQCVRVARDLTGTDAAKQLELIQVLMESQNVQPGRVPESLRTWGLELVDQKLQAIDGEERVLSWATADEGVWPPESRRLESGQSIRLASSLGRGESYTGRRVSDPFPAPKQIAFWLAGHNGFPKEIDHGKNQVRLVRADSGAVLLEATPPRNDTATRILWDTAALQGSMVRVECIDGDQAGAYAWLAVGGFEPVWLDESMQGESLVEAINLIRRLGLNERETKLRNLLDEGKLAQSLRLQVAQAIANLSDHKPAELLLQSCQRSGAPSDLVESLISAAVGGDADAILEPTKELCKRLSLQQQVQLATEWAKFGADVDVLLDLTQRGWLSPVVLVSGDAAQAIETRLSPQQRELVHSLTENLNLDVKQTELLQHLQATITSAGADRVRGQALYTKHCANCHQLRNEGAVVGPQLDGAATRSMQRLLEDIITPDRNVDHAFRTTSFLLDDGRVISGLVTSENEREILVVEPTGKPITVEVDAIEQRRDAGRSLMPSNMGEVLKSDELRDLIRYVQGP